MDQTIPHPFPPRYATFPFIPIAWYEAELNAVYFLKEEILYRVVRIDDTLELLWHPHKTEVIGVKINIAPAKLISMQQDDEPLALSNMLSASFETQRATMDRTGAELLEKWYRVALDVVKDEVLVSPDRPTVHI